MKTVCSHCLQTVQIDDRLQGRPATCPLCGQIFDAYPAPDPVSILEPDEQSPPPPTQNADDELAFSIDDDEDAAEGPQSSYRIPDDQATRPPSPSGPDSPYMAATGGGTVRDQPRSPRRPQTRDLEPLWPPRELLSLLALPRLAIAFLTAGLALAGFSGIAALYGLFREGGSIGAALANLLTCLIGGLVLVAVGQAIKVFLGIDRKVRESHQTLQAILHELRSEKTGNSQENRD